MIMTISCAPSGNKRDDELLSKDELPVINNNFTCDDLYMWRQEVYMIYQRKQLEKEKQLKKHQ